jgi:GTP-binding protein HflX
VVLSDTVGFIRDLPTQLVAAFRATLDETVHADLLLHVVDASSPVRHEQIEQVNRVLAEIDASDIPQIVVMNKIDAAPELLEQGPRIERNEEGVPTRVHFGARRPGPRRPARGMVEVAQWLATRPVALHTIRAWNSAAGGRCWDADDPRRRRKRPDRAADRPTDRRCCEWRPDWGF